jgi:hypothetical protein
MATKRTTRSNADPAAASAAPKRRRTSAAVEQAPIADSSEPAVADDGSAIEADRVDVRMGAVGRVDAGRLDVHQGAVGAARADTITVAQGALGAALADEVQIRQGVGRAILARTVAVEQSFVRTLVAGEVRIERATGVGILIARKVVGDVRVLLDWRGALAFGAAFGLVVGLIRRGRPSEQSPPGRPGRKR